MLVENGFVYENCLFLKPLQVFHAFLKPLESNGVLLAILLIVLVSPLIPELDVFEFDAKFPVKLS